MTEEVTLKAEEFLKIVEEKLQQLLSEEKDSFRQSILRDYIKFVKALRNFIETGELSAVQHYIYIERGLEYIYVSLETPTLGIASRVYDVCTLDLNHEKLEDLVKKIKDRLSELIPQIIEDIKREVTETRTVDILQHIPFIRNKH